MSFARSLTRVLLFHLLLQLFTTLRTSLSALPSLLVQLLLRAQQFDVRHLRRIALPLSRAHNARYNRPDAIHNAGATVLNKRSTDSGVIMYANAWRRE